MISLEFHPIIFRELVISLELKKCGTKMRLKIVLEPSDEGGYTAYVPVLPGCISEGDSKEEAIKNIREAIELYLEPVDDDFIPPEKAGILELSL